MWRSCWFYYYVICLSFRSCQSKIKSDFILIIIYKTRLAADIGKGPESRLFSGIFDVMTKTIKSVGVRGLYNGFLASFLGIFLYRGLYFGFYDAAKSFAFKEGEHPGFLKNWLVA